MAPPSEPVLFQVVCTPSRSLSARGFRLLAVMLALFAGMTAAMFLLLGAWPILPFLGAEVGFALALVAMHARASARMAEIVVLTAGELTVTQIDARGRRRDMVLDPYWARATYRQDPATAGVLTLRSRGRIAEVGRHLGAEEKAALHDALVVALARARQPVFDNPQLR